MNKYKLYGELTELPTGFQKEPVEFEFLLKVHVIDLTT